MDVTFTAQIIPDSFQTFQVNKDALVKDVIKEVLRAVAAEGGQAKATDYRILVTYQLTVPEATLEKLARGHTVDAENDRLQDIKFQDGFSILFVKPIVMSTKLELYIRKKRIRVLDRHETLIGRPDPDKGVNPDLDLTPYLGENERKVSRRQALITEENGKWMIQLDPEAKSTVFLNEQMLELGVTYEIADDSIISFGPTLEQPYLRITTKLNSD